MTHSGESFASHRANLVIPILKLIAGPVVAVIVYLLAMRVWPHAPSATAAVGTWMAVWWILESIPLPMTALIPVFAFPLLGVFDGRTRTDAAVWYQQGTADPILAVVKKAGSREATIAWKTAEEGEVTKVTSWSTLKPVQSISGIQAATAPFGDANIFTYFGGFVLALALERWGLHRRLALRIVRFVGLSPPRLLLGVMLSTAFLSMWISNTAATTIMLPIALGICAMMRQNDPNDITDSSELSRRPIDSMILISIAYAATIGGMATSVGTPTNGVGINVLKNQGIVVTFAEWLTIAGPTALTMLVAAWMVLLLYFRPQTALPGQSAVDSIESMYRNLGRMQLGERMTMWVFIATASCWVLRSPIIDGLQLGSVWPWLRSIDDTVIAVVAAVLLFALPVNLLDGQFLMDWQSLRELPWGVLLLFGGGLSLASAMQTSGLIAEMELMLAACKGVPSWLLWLLIVLGIVFLSELASNVAVATAFAPVVLALAVAIDQPAKPLVLAATLAASCGFMLPVATPPNAIVFGTGRIRQRDMIRAGLVLNLISALVVSFGVWAIVRS